MSVCNTVFTRQRGFLSRLPGRLWGNQELRLQREWGKEMLGGFLGILQTSPGVPGHADPGEGQGRCRTQVLKLGENKVLLIIVINLHIVRYSLQSIFHECGPSRLM